ncbi:MAG: DUF2442 domain-containing protein [Leptospiraceae bacterium]|nr:DUF2442 domain-containing protein [Leptospiraceae bacterium]
MLVDIIYVKPRKPYFLFLKFEDGLSGLIDFREQVSFEGVFAVLEDWNYFQKVKVNPELGTITWPNQADLDPIVLYELIKNRKSLSNKHEK